jgi:Pyruvate/2-oxoacid:ferredoxin oxidoreductase gamma subunit
MQPGSQILICTGQGLEAFEELKGFSLGLINALAIAEKLGLGHVMNTVVLGAYCRLNSELDVEQVIEAVTDMVPAKKEQNVEAVRRGYEKLIL